MELYKKKSINLYNVKATLFSLIKSYFGIQLLKQKLTGLHKI